MDWFNTTSGINDYSGAGIGSGSNFGSGMDALGGNSYGNSIGTSGSFTEGLGSAGYSPSWGDRFQSSAQNYLGNSGSGLMDGMLAGSQQVQNAPVPVGDPTSNIGVMSALKNLGQQPADPFKEWSNPFLNSMVGSIGGFR